MLERMALPLRGLSNAIASFMKAFYRALGGPGRLLEDFLNGTWLGHSLHAVLVDVVIGSATAALFLDILRVIFGVSGLEDATSWIVGLAFLSALGAVVTGLTDYKDTSPDSAQRDVAGLHGLINIVATHRLRPLPLAAPRRQPRCRILGPAGLVPGRERGRLHRRPRRLQVRLHGELQRLLAEGSAPRSSRRSRPRPMCPRTRPRR